MTLVLIDTGKDALKKYGDLWKKIKDLIRPTSSNNHDKKYMKIIRWWFTFEKKAVLELHHLIIVRSILYDDKYYPQSFLDECLYKLA